MLRSICSASNKESQKIVVIRSARRVEEHVISHHSQSGVSPMRSILTNPAITVPYSIIIRTYICANRTVPGSRSSCTVESAVMVNPHVLLIGGHGKVSQHLTPLLLAKSWSVTSLIRDQAQSAAIEKLGKDQPGKLNVLVRSLEDIKSENDAGKILDEVSPEYVVWSAGQ